MTGGIVHGSLGTRAVPPRRLRAPDRRQSAHLPALTDEHPAGELQLAKVGAHQYNAVLTYPAGESAVLSAARR